jgi:hypothetical protein
MSERKIKKLFKLGDIVSVKRESGEKLGFIQNFLASQYTIKYDDGNVDFFFYNEACPMKHADAPSAVDDAALAMMESAAKTAKKKKVKRKRT